MEAKQAQHKLHIMVTSIQTLSYSYLVWQYKPGETAAARICSYLITGDQPILVDTGYQDIPILRKQGLEIATEPEWDLVNQIEKMGLKAEDIKYIVLTHLHMDHCGQLDRFPNARIVIQRKELMYAASPLHPAGMPLGFKRAFYRGRDVANLETTCWNRLEIIEGDREIVPGVRCVLMGGHTTGSQAVYVDTKDGTAVITGDICPCFINFETGGYMAGIYHNWDEIVLAQRKMIAEGAVIIPSHDPEILTRFPTQTIG